MTYSQRMSTPISISCVLNGTTILPEYPIDDTSSPQVSPLAPPYFEKNSLFELLYEVQLIRRIWNPTVNLVLRIFPKPTSEKFEILPYTNGEVITGYVDVENKGSVEVPFKALSVSLMGLLKLNHNRPKRFLHLIDLVASSSGTGVDNYVDVDFELLSEKYHLSADSKIGLPSDHILQPRSKYRKFFVFQLPYSLLEDTCEHGIASHFTLPPTTLKKFSEVKYSVLASLIVKSLKYGFHVSALQDRPFRFVPQFSFPVDLESLMPDSDTYRQQFLTKLESIEKLEVAETSKIEAATKMQYSSLCTKLKLACCLSSQASPGRYESIGRCTKKSVFGGSSSGVLLASIDRVNQMEIRLSDSFLGSFMAVPLNLELQYIPPFSSKRQGPHPAIKSMSVSLEILESQSLGVIPFKIDHCLLNDFEGVYLEKIKSGFKALTSRVEAVKCQSFKTELDNDLGAVDSLTIYREKILGLKFESLAPGHEIWSGYPQDDGSSHWTSHIQSSVVFDSSIRDMYLEGKLDAIQMCNMNRMYLVNVALVLSNGLKANVCVPVKFV
ncbi:hypothetical protein BABINDRAFT_8889 [Babjeviella inositovora NRRL Y-12698]|uniref:Bul1 N-terminal domain-containing protein n=1 Tax=Babjeviella inositovora NRRL Y-12698 TaxID=984486 RepID=A0A1E3QLR6_9ASCO|nr:uncharacterized protein BABINDRAFT_8889 [Babjeviella inositovora NRRL Y-12698]ODQ78633.1 hypothetical protein BABINDRAFT_8889 [Babjeviella inositovora NRRL Y-12698]